MSLTADQVKHNSGSSKTFATALVANAALLFVEVGAFIILKQKLQRIYSPRTFLPPPEKRASDLPKGTWRWLPAVMLADPRDIVSLSSLLLSAQTLTATSDTQERLRRIYVPPILENAHVDLCIFYIPNFPCYFTCRRCKHE